MKPVIGLNFLVELIILIMRALKIWIPNAVLYVYSSFLLSTRQKRINEKRHKYKTVVLKGTTAFS